MAAAATGRPTSTARKSTGWNKQLPPARPKAVEDYVELLLKASPLPDEVPVDVDVAYQPDARKLVVIRELPGVAIIPEAREHSYFRNRDEIAAKPRPAKEIRQRYTSLVAQLVLRTMREVFEIRPTTLVDEVAVNGHVSIRNKATGQSERPCLVSVSATREQFKDLVRRAVCHPARNKTSSAIPSTFASAGSRSPTRQTR